jgi:2'-5' RNA ligase
MSLVVIAYPELKNADHELIQSFRKRYDRQYLLIDPHFTIVFPTEIYGKEEFISEIRQKVHSFKKFSFTLNKAQAVPDKLSGQYHVFLVADEGFDEIVAMHDAAYSGLLSADLRRDIEYLPHITTAGPLDKSSCDRIAGEWNSLNSSIQGMVKEIIIAEYVDGKVSEVGNFPLRKDSGGS